MPAVISSELLVRLTQASPEQLAAIERILNTEGRSGPCWAGQQCEVRSESAGLRFVFRQIGELWQVVFDGGEVFHLEDSMGARYLDHLLHHPNVPIKAVDLEAIIQPVKKDSRARNSTQTATDAKAVRAYLRELDRLRADCEEAAASGNQIAVAEAEAEIRKVEAALRLSEGGSADNGERARGNVRKALQAIERRLLKGGGVMRAFGEHLREHVSTGYECLYSQPEGRIWG
jgi:hypothetical protein